MITLIFAKTTDLISRVFGWMGCNKTTTRNMPIPEKYASCPYDGGILEFYKGQFESVFILLHPFIHPQSINLELFTSETWPNKQEIIEGCKAIKWEEVLELTDLDSLAEIDVGLRTYILGLGSEFSNEVFAKSLEKFIEEKRMIIPEEGDIPPLLQNRIFRAIKSLDYQWLWVGDEFGEERKLHWIDDLIMSDDEIPAHACIFTHDHNLLITSHWDSHCTFLCSSKENIEKILASEKFEGFYCSDKTQVYWGLSEI